LDDSPGQVCSLRDDPLRRDDLKQAPRILIVTASISLCSGLKAGSTTGGDSAPRILPDRA
jgi:hypothetical protein